MRVYLRQHWLIQELKELTKNLLYTFNKRGGWKCLPSSFVVVRLNMAWHKTIPKKYFVRNKQLANSRIKQHKVPETLKF